MPTCQADQCDGDAHAQGLCHRHYMRLRRHGSTDQTRPRDWGKKSKHPMWERYKSMLRVARRTGGYDPRWDDFWTFVDDVGDPPEPNSRLYRKDEELPYQKENLEWRAPILSGERLSDHAAYQRAYRMKRGSVNRDRYLRNTYGITLEDYNRILAEQGGGCAICGVGTSHLHPITREPVSLAMDHSSITGKNRGILCGPCNRGIGLLLHNPDLLRAAIAYLDRHAAEG